MSLGLLLALVRCAALKREFPSSLATAHKSGRVWRFLILAFGVVWCASCAWADAITNANPFNVTMVLNADGRNFNGNGTVMLPQFDEMSGARKLQQVNLSISGVAQGNATAENNQATAGTFQVAFPILFTGTGPGNSQSLGVITVATSPLANLAASDGIPNQGPDFTDFGLFTDSKPDTEPIPAAGAFDSFIGSGKFSVAVSGGGTLNTRGTLTDVNLNIRSINLLGNVTVVYTFTNVPEPGSIGLLSMGILCLLGCERRCRRARFVLRQNDRSTGEYSSVTDYFPHSA